MMPIMQMIWARSFSTSSNRGLTEAAFFLRGKKVSTDLAIESCIDRLEQIETKLKLLASGSGS